MPTIRTVLILFFIPIGASVASAASVDVFLSGSAFTYSDQSAITSTHSIGSLPPPPTSECRKMDEPALGHASCFSFDSAVFNLDSFGQGDVNPTSAAEPNPIHTFTDLSFPDSIAKTDFAVAAAFAQAGGQFSTAGQLTGTPVIDLGDIVVVAREDPYGSLFAFELTNVSPKALNNNILSESFLGKTAKDFLPLAGTFETPSETFYKLVVKLGPTGDFTIDQGGSLFLPANTITAQDFIAECPTPPAPIGLGVLTNGSGPGFGPCSPGMFGQHLQARTISLKTIPATNIDQNFNVAQLSATTVPAVPEPSTLFLLGSALAGLAGWRFIRRHQ